MRITLNNIGTFHNYSNKIFFIIICIIIVASLYDSLLIKLYRFIYGQVFSGSDIEESTTRNTITFIMLVSVYGIGQYLSTPLS